jgi:hypothetical protein
MMSIRLLAPSVTCGIVMATGGAPTLPVSPVDAAIADARNASGWGGCVRIIYELDAAAHSFAEETPSCYQIHLDPGDAKGRYMVHVIGHELCHIAVGINHSHDLIFRACMTKVSAATGMQEIYNSDSASYPYQINDLRTGQHWNWPIAGGDAMTL